MRLNNMRNSKAIVKTNLKSATPAQKEKFIKTLVEAHRILFISVLERHLLSLTPHKLS